MVSPPTVKIPKPPQGRVPVRILPRSSVTGFFGPKGSGKSAAMAYYAEKGRKREGRRVFYFPERYRFHDGTALRYEDLVTLAEMDPEDESGHLSEITNSIVLLDEFQQIFSKYRSSTYANRAVASFLQQIRKRGVTLFFTSNDPDGIDEAATIQTDEHAFCKYYPDPRCEVEGEGWHLVGCRDWIRLRFVDTHGRHGRDPRYFDGRKRRVKVIRNAITIASYYNTFASISSQEVSQMNAQAVQTAYEVARSGIREDELERFFRVFIIPWLITEKGAREILPATFLDQVIPTITRESFVDDETGEDQLASEGLGHIRLPLDISVQRLGKILQALGLQKKRGSGGYRYQLPEEGDLADWQSGIIQE